MDFEFRRGLGLALLGIAFLLGAIFFGELAVASAPYGATITVIGPILSIPGGLLSPAGAAMLASRPPDLPQFPPRM